MMEERYHATTQDRFYPDMSNVNKNITLEAKLISPPTCIVVRHCMCRQSFTCLQLTENSGVREKFTCSRNVF